MEKNIKSSLIGTVIGVLLLAVGIFLVQVYILGLRFLEFEIYPPVFFLGAASLISLSLTFLWISRCHLQKPLLLILLVFIVAFFLIKIPTLRFAFIPGSDLLGEYYAAQKTVASQIWPPDLPFNPRLWLPGRSNYFWTTSVTILPAAISRITGLPVTSIFEVVFPLVSAVIPVLIFVLMRQVFGTRVASLSSIVYILNPIYLDFFNLMKENLAFVSFLLSLFCILKSVKHKDSRFGFLALVFVFTTVALHYVMGDFAVLASFVVFLSPKLHIVFRKISTHSRRLRPFFPPKWNPVVIVRSTLFLFFAVSLFAWLLLASPVMQRHVKIVSNALSGLTGTAAPQRHYMITEAWISPFGLYHTLISNSIKLLVALGFFIALRISNTTESFSLTLLGGAMLGVLVGWMIIPNISFGLFIDRVYGVSFWVFSTFIALSLIKLSSKLQRRKLPRWTSFIPMFLLTVFFIEGFLTMPSIYWHAKGSLAVEDVLVVPYRGSKLIAIGSWINQNVEKENMLIVDGFTMDIKIFAEARVSKRALVFEFFNASDPRNVAISSGYDYLVASSWMMDGYISFKDATTGGRVVWTLERTKIQMLNSDFDALYCNGNYSLFHLSRFQGND